MMEALPRTIVGEGSQKWLDFDYIVKIGYTGLANGIRCGM